MTRDLNLALAGPIAGLTLLAFVGLMGCTTTPATAGGAAGTSAPPTDASPPTTVSTDAPTRVPTVGPSDLRAQPVAVLVATQGTILGALGTYVMDGRASDVPWLPFTADPSVGLGRGEVVTIRFADRATIGDAVATYAAAADTTGARSAGAPGGARAADGSAMTVGPFPPGQWVLAARLVRADGRGDGLTYWAITVR